MKALIESSSPTALVDWIRKYSRDSNFEAVLVGRRQSGKSTCALALAKRIDPGFNMSRVCFSAHQFLKVVNDPARKRGDVIILEEAGVNVSRAEWYTAVNKALLFVSQTYGWKGLIVFLTLPSMRYLDTRVAMMLTAYIEMIRIDKHARELKFKFQTIRTIMKLGGIGPEMKYDRPITYIQVAENFRVRAIIDYFVVDFPDRKDLLEYYRYADEYKQNLAESLEEETAKMDKSDTPFSFSGAAEEITINFRDYLNEKSKWIIDKIVARYGIPSAKARVLVQVVEDKMKAMGLVKPEPVVKVPVKVFRDVQKPINKNKEITGEKWADVLKKRRENDPDFLEKK